MDESALTAIDAGWTLSGRRVTLRRLREADLPERLTMTNDPEIQTETLGMTVGERTPYDMRSWFSALSRDPSSRQVAVEDPQGRYLGDFDVHSIDTAREEAWVEALFGPRWLRDAGPEAVPAYLEDALGTLLEYLFGAAGLRKVWVECLSTHPVLLEALRRLGFMEDGKIDHMNGVFSHVMALRRDAFRQAPPGHAPGR